MAMLKSILSLALRQHRSVGSLNPVFRCFEKTVCTTAVCRVSDLPPMKHILKQNNIPEEDRKKIEKEVEEMTKDWTSHGFHSTDKYEDLYRYNFSFFMLFTVFTSIFVLYMWYLPNKGNHDWARREAFLEIERRKRDGLPLVDPDLVPASQVQLPSDEDLGRNFKIII